ncbi:MAG: hypothetical protein CME70_14100 [Halobacteriovorax sp.]|nr:hypothetical protein [Halobacteriovorax sp.]|tara:strand:+ start:600 stop:824 length:225 start_codon:yes stop_codon:yes gene_type:complete
MSYRPKNNEDPPWIDEGFENNEIDPGVNWDIPLRDSYDDRWGWDDRSNDEIEDDMYDRWDWNAHPLLPAPGYFR